MHRCIDFFLYYWLVQCRYLFDYPLEKEQEERAQRRTRDIQLTANILSHEMKMKRIFFKQNRVSITG